MSEAANKVPADLSRLPRVALVGRPNVGKSSLFNRMLGRREAIVLDRPGVTRDRLERPCRLLERTVMLEDTGGIVPEAEGELLRAVTRQALSAVQAADVVVLVIDGRAGATPLDLAVADVLRRATAPVLLAVNKIDTPAREPEAVEGWRLGLGPPHPISAEQSLGIESLVDAIEAVLPPPRAAEVGVDVSSDLPPPAEELQIAIVGRPNVGKSSLVNRLAGTDRVTVSSQPGTTRDAVDVTLTRDGRRVRLVDTAGLRRRSRVESPDEQIGILFARRRLLRCHVAILVLDATMGPTTQDAAIAGEITEAGRPLVAALNKWDLVERPEQRVKELDDDFERRLAFVDEAPRITVSALTGRNVFKLLDQAFAIVESASRRISTPDLNRFLAEAVGERLAGGAATPRALYITQTGVLPPRFVVFCRDPGSVDPPFRRYLARKFREAFGLGPTPIVLDFRPSR